VSANDHETRRGRVFGAVAGAYNLGRPSYPAAAVSWLVGEAPLRVLDLGAGTGKLTAVLCTLGHDVVAVEPDAEMLQVLRETNPGVQACDGSAEALPFEDASVDAVVCGQAFHWFDQTRALPQIHRVLRRGGRLGLVWNRRDSRVRWVEEFERLVREPRRADQPAELARQSLCLLASSPLFRAAGHRVFDHAEPASRETLVAGVASRSAVVGLAAADREALLCRVGAFVDHTHQSPQAFFVPYRAEAFRYDAVELHDAAASV
jgi:SAM-dependent methyltransferase